MHAVVTPGPRCWATPCNLGETRWEAALGSQPVGSRDSWRLAWSAVHDLYGAGRTRLCMVRGCAAIMLPLYRFVRVRSVSLSVQHGERKGCRGPSGAVGVTATVTSSEECDKSAGQERAPGEVAGSLQADFATRHAPPATCRSPSGRHDVGHGTVGATVGPQKRIPAKRTPLATKLLRKTRSK